MTEQLLITGPQRLGFAAMKRTGFLGVLIACPLATSGCVTVNAPEKPIEINLNIKITQEVVYRLNDDAKNLIQDNPGIF